MARTVASQCRAEVGNILEAGIYLQNIFNVLQIELLRKACLLDAKLHALNLQSLVVRAGIKNVAPQNR